MKNPYSLEALLDFLTHASQRGILPTATAAALTVAARSVLGMLNPDEQHDLRTTNLDSAINRFNNKRAEDVSPASLKEYGQRTRRAVEHFLRWHDDPENFSAKTRQTKKRAALLNKGQASPQQGGADTYDAQQVESRTVMEPQVVDQEKLELYDTAFPIRPGVVAWLTNIPYNLTKAEAERLAQFVRMLAIR